MRSEDEIREKIKTLKSMFFYKNNTEFQKIILANKVNELKWVIKDYSDDSWMILQEDNE
jgi:hypothetical protein